LIHRPLVVAENVGGSGTPHHSETASRRFRQVSKQTDGQAAKSCFICSSAAPSICFDKARNLAGLSNEKNLMGAGNRSRAEELIEKLGSIQPYGIPSKARSGAKSAVRAALETGEPKAHPQGPALSGTGRGPAADPALDAALTETLRTRLVDGEIQPKPTRRSDTARPGRRSLLTIY